jgi:hypothetical protein
MNERTPVEHMEMFQSLRRRIGGTVALVILYFVFLVIWLWFFADGTNPWLLSLGIQINFWRNWSIFILGFLITAGLIALLWITFRPTMRPPETTED